MNENSVLLCFRLVRGKHTIMMPVALSQDIVPSAVFYGTVTPMLVYFTVKKLIVDPFISDQKEK